MAEKLILQAAACQEMNQQWKPAHFFQTSSINNENQWSLFFAFFPVHCRPHFVRTLDQSEGAGAGVPGHIWSERKKIDGAFNVKWQTGHQNGVLFGVGCSFLDRMSNHHFTSVVHATRCADWKWHESLEVRCCSPRLAKTHSWMIGRQCACCCNCAVCACCRAWAHHNLDVCKLA